LLPAPVKDTTVKKTLMNKIKEEERKNENSLKIRAEKFLSGWIFQGSMTIITVYSLFGDDLRQLFFTSN
jgi:hypothetical protein